MPSTYTSNLKIELIPTGDQVGTWGVTTNDNFQYVFEEAIVGTGNPDFATDADLTLTLVNSVGNQTARNVYLNVTSSVVGGLTATRNLIVPTIYKNYVIYNNTTGGQSIVVKTSAGTGVTVPNGKKVPVYVDNTNVIAAFDYLSGNVTVGGNATVTGNVATVNATLSGNLVAVNATLSGNIAGAVATFSGDSSFTSTGALKVPVGTTAQQPTGANGKIRYNTDYNQYQGYSAGQWTQIGGGATGGGGDQVFVENGVEVTTSYTLSTGKNAESVGPITINSGAAVTVPANQRWVIL